MKLTTGQIFAQLTDFWKTKSRKAKKRIVLLTASFFLIAASAAIFINNTGDVVLYNNLSSSEVGEMVSSLNDMGIDFKVKTNGEILVPKEDEARILMGLASEGYPNSTLNYDIFSGNSGFMTTEYEKQKYLLFQLQNRLQDAIKTIDGIDNAIVTIGLPEEDSFVLDVDKIPSTASVVLDLVGVTELSAKQVKGIEVLVSNSVPGLASENVAIVSNTGDLLNTQSADESGNAGYTKFELEKTISETIEQKVTRLLSPIFGYDSVRVAVNTMVDVDKKVSEQTTFTPILENSGLISSQNLESDIVRLSDSEGGVPGTKENTSVPTYPEGDGADNNGSVSESSSTTYLHNQLVEQVHKDGYEITDITISVLIGSKELTDQEISDYQQMVAFASGIAPEKVEITDAVFMTPEIPEASPEEESGFSLKDNWIYVAAAGLLVLIIIIVIVIRGIRKKRKINPDEGFYANQPYNPKMHNESLNPQLYKEPSGLLPEEIVLNESREVHLKKQIKDFTSTNPEIVAQLVRTMLKEDDGNE